MQLCKRLLPDQNGEKSIALCWLSLGEQFLELIQHEQVDLSVGRQRPEDMAESVGVAKCLPQITSLCQVGETGLD